MPEREVRYCTTEDGVRIALDPVRLYEVRWRVEDSPRREEG